MYVSHHREGVVKAIAQVGLAQRNPAPQLLQPSYTIGDIKFGISGDDWSVQLFVNNVTDERAVLFDNPNELERFFAGEARQTVNRPREIGISFRKSFKR